jgi:phenylacetate-CoA ligase
VRVPGLPHDVLYCFSAWASRSTILRSRRALERVLENAARFVPFYKDLLARGKPGLRGIAPISRADVLAAPRLFRSQAIRDTSCYAKTSGTSGPPLRVWFDRASWYETNYSSYDIFRRAFPQLDGLFRLGRVGVALITTKPSRRALNTLVPSLSFARVIRRVLTDSPARCRAIAGELDRARPPLFYGKSAALLHLLSIDSGADLSPSGIIVGGEPLFEDVREQLETGFRCPVLSTYASAEGGLMAIECLFRTGLHVLHSRVVLEVLRPDGGVGSAGTGELVLTNLWNWAMPFIRYRTGDYGTISARECPCGHTGQTITSLAGREPHTLRAGRQSVSTAAIADALLPLNPSHFEVHASPRGSVLVRWKPRDAADSRAAPFRSIRTALASLFSGTHIRSEMLTDPAPPGGKIRRFVQLDT